MIYLPILETNAVMSITKKPSHVSEFYLACRNGDTDFVKKYLANLKRTEDDFNRLESCINSTPLHAACYYGHKEIVELLLKHGCDRSKINGYSLTAFEEAANDEIRQLFRRPQNLNSDGNRFQDESIRDCFDFVKRPKDLPKEVETPVETPSSQTLKRTTVQTYKTAAEKKLEIGYATTSIAMCQSKLGRFIADKFQEDAPMSMTSIGNRLQDLITRELIANKDPESSKALELLNKFLSEDSQANIKYLIRLYTLETNFYRSLRKNPMPLALPLYMTLQTLKERYFQGISYRGAKMADDEIEIYKVAVHNNGTLLQTKHFSSTSQKRCIAEEFADAAIEKSNNTRKNRVLFIFNFPVACDQAINLSRISDTEPSLSEFESESEVLLLPWTLFQVERVHEESPLSYTIYLTNVLLPRKNIYSSMKWIIKHPKGSMNRFREHFPEGKQHFGEK